MTLRNSGWCRKGRGMRSLQVDGVSWCMLRGGSLISEVPGLMRPQRLSIPTRQGPSSHQLPDGEGLIQGHELLSLSLWIPTGFPFVSPLQPSFRSCHLPVALCLIPSACAAGPLQGSLHDMPPASFPATVQVHGITVTQLGYVLIIHTCSQMQRHVGWGKVLPSLIVKRHKRV